MSNQPTKSVVYNRTSDTQRKMLRLVLVLWFLVLGFLYKDSCIRILRYSLWLLCVCCIGILCYSNTLLPCYLYKVPGLVSWFLFPFLFFPFSLFPSCLLYTIALVRLLFPLCFLYTITPYGCCFVFVC